MKTIWPSVEIRLGLSYSVLCKRVCWGFCLSLSLLSECVFPWETSFDKQFLTLFADVG